MKKTYTLHGALDVSNYHARNDEYEVLKETTGDPGFVKELEGRFVTITLEIAED